MRSRSFGLAGADQAVLGRVQSGHGPAGDLELGVDAFQVVGHGLRAEDKPAGDLLVRVAAGQEPEYLGLTCGQAGWKVPAAGGAVSGGGQDGGHGIAVEAAGSGLGPKCGDGRGGRVCGVGGAWTR